MLRVTSLLVFLFAFGCSNRLPAPVLLEESSPATAQLSAAETVVNSLIFVDVDAKRISLIRELVKFLITDFGPPINSFGKLSIRVESTPGQHAFVEYYRNGDRIVVIDPLDFLSSEQHFIVHELFHALYQSEGMLALLSDADAEGWATYAQLRYKYKLIVDNEGIADAIRRENRLSRKTEERLRHLEAPLITLDSKTRYDAYIVNALELFDLNHQSVRDEYRRLVLASE